MHDNLGNIIIGKKCSFCRTPFPTSEASEIKRLKKRMEVDDTYAFFLMGYYYGVGECGLPQNSTKAMELWHKAGRDGYTNLGHSYYNGVERDTKMASHYYELAAMEGNSYARHNLGSGEYDAGNYDRALKHFMIAVKGGHTNSVKAIQEIYMDGHAAKDYYANALRSHQAYLDEIKSPQRDEAAALGDKYRYY